MNAQKARILLQYADFIPWQCVRNPFFTTWEHLCEVDELSSTHHQQEKKCWNEGKDVSDANLHCGADTRDFQGIAQY